GEDGVDGLVCFGKVGGDVVRIVKDKIDVKKEGFEGMMVCRKENLGWGMGGEDVGKVVRGVREIGVGVLFDYELNE
ncbi:hypothetical protein, partial [Bacillus subtilis]|uniref:hypothetical protein n=1 Tax=Bacillus subtilis TaxID=1423 RepID=UPI0016435D31